MQGAAAISDDTLTLTGVLDFESVLEVDKVGRAWLESKAPAQAFVDLSGVTYSSSVGIALLLGWLRVAQQQQKCLQLHQVPADMSALALVGGLDDLFGAAKLPA